MLYTYRFFSMPTDASGSSNSISSAKYCRSNILINYLTKLATYFKISRSRDIPKENIIIFFTTFEPFSIRGSKKKLTRFLDLISYSFKVNFNKYDGCSNPVGS